MLPRWHIFLGAIFSIIFLILFPSTAWYGVAIVFLSSFLIDFDHYMCAVKKTNKIWLGDALNYHKILMKKEKEDKRKKIFRKSDFHVFHTLEFHLLVLALAFVYSPFIYIFVGMLFHSLVDVIDMSYKKRIYRREFLLINWLRKNALFSK